MRSRSSARPWQCPPSRPHRPGTRPASRRPAGSRPRRGRSPAGFLGGHRTRPAAGRGGRWRQCAFAAAPAGPRRRAPRTGPPASGRWRCRPRPRCLGAARAGRAPWRACRTGRRTGTAPRAAGPGARGRPAPGGSAPWCPAKSAGRPAPGRHASPRWHRRPGSRTRWPFRRRTAAGSTRCRPWQCPGPCPCRCGCAWDRPPAARASGGGTWRARPRPWGTRGRAAGAPRARGRGCAGCRGRRCGWSRSRRRTDPRGRAAASPWETGRSGRRAPRTRRG